MMQKFILVLAASSLATLAMPAAATTVVDGNCVSVTNVHGCLFDGNINSSGGGKNSYLLAQSAYNIYNNTHPTASPDIFLNVLFASDDVGFSGMLAGAGSFAGTWSTPGYLVSYLAVKASDKFVLYKLAVPASSGSWNTSDIPFTGAPHDLSHLVFFGEAGAVPEPTTWALILAGFGIVGGSLRSRRHRMVVSYG